jgi:hypothetical protein
MYLTTNDSSGGTIAPSGDAFTIDDFFVHKNGSAVQKTTSNGMTIVSPFDSVVGVHSLSIDTSNNTGDAGFWNSGCDYSVIASPSGTVDSQIVAGLVGSFSIQNRSVQSALNDLTARTLASASYFNHEIHRVSISGNIDTLDDLNNVSTSDLDAALSTYDGPTRAEATADKEEIITSGDANWSSSSSATLANQLTIITQNNALSGDLIEVQGSGFVESTDSLESIRNRGDSAWITSTATGTGARTVNIGVNDGTDPIQGATVRVLEGINTYSLTTSAVGSGTFNLDDATYDLSISKAGYNYAGTTLVVNGTENETYSMAQSAIAAPPNASTSTGVAHLYDHMGVKEVGAKASVQITSGPGASGISYDRKIWTETSDSGGMIQFSGLIREAIYDYWRGSSKASKVSITVPNTLSFNLDEIIGSS